MTIDAPYMVGHRHCAIPLYYVGHGIRLLGLHGRRVEGDKLGHKISRWHRVRIDNMYRAPAYSS